VLSSFPLSAIPVVFASSCELWPAPARVGGGGASRVAAKGPRSATKEPVGERRGPTPARSHPSRGPVSRGFLGASSQPPTEPTSTLRQRHAPHAGFLALEVMPPAPLVGLVDGLPADSQGVPDLGPGSAVATGCRGQQIANICQGFLGVSHLLERFQRLLRSSQGARQVLDHPAQSRPRVGAFFGAHVNGYWQRPRTAANGFASIPINRPKAANCCKHSICGKEVNGAPFGDIPTPGDYVRPHGPIFGSNQPKKETPQELQLLGVVDDIRGN
jgi:hypothetical protein